MARSVARGKALVAKLRANPKVRDAEALAAWAGRVKKLRAGGLSASAARKAAGKPGGSKGTDAKPDATASRFARGGGGVSPQQRARMEREKASAVKKAADDVGDPFGEDFGDGDEQTPEQKAQEKLEKQVLAAMYAKERALFNDAIKALGGIKPTPGLAEEYRAVPLNFRNNGGFSGDDVAQSLSYSHPEFGIQTEQDLLDYFNNAYGVGSK